MAKPIDLPVRLAAAAAAIANARAGRRGAPPLANVLEILPAPICAEVIADARAALDAAEAAEPLRQLVPGDPFAERIHLAASVGFDLGAQAVVLIDVARDGTVTGSTWAARAGTPSVAIADWTRGLTATAITPVPFQTCFGWGRGGIPTPLTPEELDALAPRQRDYALRHTVSGEG